MKFYPLTQSQLGIYLDWNADRDSIRYNIANDSIFSVGSIDVNRLRDALNKVLNNYCLFKLKIAEDNGAIVQYVDDSVKFDVEITNVADANEAINDFVKPFNPFVNENARVEIVVAEKSIHILTDFFHMFFDGTSFSRFNEIVQMAYDGKEIPADTMAFVNYAESEPALLETPNYNAAKEDHIKRFAGKSMTIPTANSSESGIISKVHNISREEVNGFCKANNIHPNLLFMGAFARTLSLYANSGDAVFGTMNHGRKDRRFAGEMGPFMKTIPVAVDFNGEMKLVDWLASLKLHNVGAYPFTHFCRDLKMKPGFGYAFQDGAVKLGVNIDGVNSRVELLSPDGNSAIPAVHIFGDSENYNVWIFEFNGGYSEAWMQGFVDRIVEVTKQFIAHPDSLLKDIPVTSESERDALYNIGFGGKLDYNKNATAVSEFVRHANATPDKVAFADSEKKITYREAYEKISAIASELDVEPNGFVCVMLPRKVEFMTSVLAIQSCGCGYVPLDVEYPNDRIEYMLKDSCASVLITTHEMFDSKKIGFNGKVIFVEDVKPNGNELVIKANPETPAYMIYTSGSTGKPKGVVIPNRALTAFIFSMIDILKLTPDFNGAVASSFSFDASVEDLFCAPFVGGTLHIISEEMRKDLASYRDYIAKEKIDGCAMSTHFGLALLNAYPDVALKFIILGGEKLVNCPKTNVKIYNGYGPTEFTVCSSVHLVVDGEDDIPIGRPLQNTTDIIVDKFNQLVPMGLDGELCLTGDQIANGYWNLPDKTAKVFVNGYYHTGDYASWNANEQLMYKGRIDKQVKLRGFRIEMGEIENAVAAFPRIETAVAEVKVVSGIEHLTLYYTANIDVNVDELKKSIGEKLASFMIPDYFIKLDKMPMTPGGKIDRKALPLPEATVDAIVEPANDIEEKILNEIRNVVHNDKIGVTHDFKSVGIDSISMMTLVAKLKKIHNISISFAKLAKASNVRELAKVIDIVKETKTPARLKRSTYPMTENQRGIYVDWLRNPTGTAYNIPFAIRFDGVNADTVANAVTKVIDAHPVLKMHFIEKDGEIVQQRRDDAKVDVKIENADEVSHEYLANLVKQFDPTGDLIHTNVIGCANGSVLFMDIHHTICDGISTGVIVNDIINAINGKQISRESKSAFDAAIDERDYLESELKAQDEEWFAKYLNGCESTVLDLGHANGSGAVTIKKMISANEINKFAKSINVSASDFFMGAFMEMLKRIGRSDDVQITFVSAGRNDADLEDSVGMFVKTLPVKNVNGEATFSGMVKKLKADVLEIRDRDRVSYAKLVEANGLKPEIVFAYEGGLFDLPNGITLESFATKTAKFPLSVTVTPIGDNFEVGFEYDASRYSNEMMEKLIDMYATFIGNAIKIDDLKSIPLANDEAKAFDKTYGGDIAYDETKTFLNLFNSVIRTRSFATAVVDENGSLTYGEIDSQSSAVAKKLICNGVKPGEFVIVKLGRVKEFISAIIGVMKAGCAYVPVDPAYPEDRINYMVADSKSKVIIDDGFLKDINAEEKSQQWNVSCIKPSDSAYMIYTSGSTGKPKGVVIPHSALRHMIEWDVKAMDITYASKVIEHASFSFDASVISIFPALAAGAEIHILAEDLRKNVPGMYEYVMKNGITTAIMSTQIGMTLLNAFPDIPLHCVMFGGEKLLPVAKTNVKIINGYGPTEFAVCSSYEVVDQSKDGDIAIGKSAPGTWSIIIDKYNHILPDGFAGELALVGPQIANGYWNQKEKTEKAFVDFNGKKMYKTGDLAKYNSEGKIEYLGRIDFQVKLRGFRIEIGEIEAVSTLFPGVGSVAAEVREIGGVKHLVLYYEGLRVDAEDLKKFMANRLADYMVPDYFVDVGKMPMTPVGKIDRKRLPTPTPKVHEYVAPANEVEKTIAEAYGKVLKIENFGATDDFFNLGGTSIVAIEAVIALQKAGLDVQYGDVFKFKTPRALAEFINGTPVESTSNFNDFDYTKIDNLLVNVRKDLFKDFHVKSLGDVLLTGASGYLGIHILHYLLNKTSSSVTVLLRQKGEMNPEQRLNIQYMYYFGEMLPKKFKDRIEYVTGDITDNDLEKKLAGVDVKTVINCAALVKHYIADDALDRVNVGGVKNLLNWCKENGVKFIQTSTYSIGGEIDAANPTKLDEHHLYVGQSSDNDYIRTKFLAERMVLDAIANGEVKGKIMRLGNLMGRESDGEFQMNIKANAFVNSLKSYNAIGAFPVEELAAPLEMSPIDRVAEAICLLATTPDDMVVFHPYNTYSLDMGAVLGSLANCGKKIEFVSEGEFADKVDTLKNDPEHEKDLQGILHYAQRHLEGKKMTPVSNSWTTTVLYRLGFRWNPADDAYLSKFFDMLDTLGVFG